MRLRIGTRGSDLALWQARHVASRLAGAAEVEITVLQTRGDLIDDVPLTGVEGKAFFTGEIERALLAGEIDVAVHSHKDLPTELAPGLAIAAVPARASPLERLLALPDAHDPAAGFLPLARGAHVGTSSPRREEQLRTLRPDLRVESLRGNVPTRVRKLRERQYDAIVLAAAGLDRLELDLAGLIVGELPLEWFVPAPAQGALAVQIRAGDAPLAALLRGRLHDEPTARAIAVERDLLARAGGGCNLPLGAAIRGEGPCRAFLFLGAGHPDPASGPRWAWGEGADPESAGDAAARKLFARAPTRCGPLAGVRVALTGSSAGGSGLGARLQALGASVVHERVIGFEDLPCPQLAERLASLQMGDAVAVTSRQAASRLAGQRVPQGVCVGAVGAATARALDRSGLHAEVIGTGGARELAQRLPVRSGARVLFPGALDALPDLERELALRGVQVERLPLYRTRSIEGIRLDPDVDARVYLSPSAVRAASTPESAAPPVCFALGRATQDALGQTGRADAVPLHTSAEELIRTLWQTFARREILR